jgi:hypothetical protein
MNTGNSESLLFLGGVGREVKEEGNKEEKEEIRKEEEIKEQENLE